MTPAERILWHALRDRQLQGLKFRRQHPLGPFVVDFCCQEKRLIVELDGQIHEFQKPQDDARTEHLKAYGYTVIRFANDAVLNDLDAVLRCIATEADSLAE